MDLGLAISTDNSSTHYSSEDEFIVLPIHAIDNKGSRPNSSAKWLWPHPAPHQEYNRGQ
jgi:hypothetical protein